LQESPGQRFIRERQQRALLRNQSAIGGLGGGNVRTALQEQAAGFAQQDLQNQFNRLGITSAGEQALQGRQQQAVTNLANIRAGLGAQQGAALIGAGQAKAQGIVGQAAGFRSGVQQAVELGTQAATLGASDIRLKENIERVGTLDSGLGWYTWDWKEGTKGIAGSTPTEGVIAQEAQELFPDAVSLINGYLHVDYARVH
jgi:hypothetical protein